MSYPGGFMPDELSTEAATELLTLLSGCPVSRGLRVWLASVRGDLADCESQDTLLDVS